MDGIDTLRDRYLSAIAAATTRITLGPYILNAYGHSPFMAGLGAIDLDELSGGRLVLGVGPGNVHINRWFQGLETERPLTKMREYTELLRQMVRAQPGGPVHFEGQIHRTQWAPRVQPVRASIPVWLAAISPKMVRVAASVADGIAMGVLLSPEYVRDAIRPVAAAAAAAADRDPDPGSDPEGGKRRRIRGEPRPGGRQRFGVEEIHQHAGLAMGDRLAHRRHIGGHHRGLFLPAVLKTDDDPIDHLGCSKARQ